MRFILNLCFLVWIYFSSTSHLFSQSLGGYPISDYLVIANHPYGCTDDYVIGPPDDSVWVNFLNGDIMSGYFSSSATNVDGYDLLLETKYNRSNYEVRLILSNGNLSSIHSVVESDWVELPQHIAYDISISCTGNQPQNTYHYVLPLDFGEDFNVTGSQQIAGIEIEFLSSVGGPDLAGAYIIGECQTVTTTTNIVSCGPYTDFGGIVYTTSGVYTTVLQSSAGCDSIVDLVLDILEPPLIGYTASSLGCGNQTEYTIVADGTGPFTFAIPSLNSSNTSGNFILNAGIYDMVVTDAFGCTALTSLNNSSANSCPQDFNQDLVVGVADLLEFNIAYGCTGDCCPYDLNSDNAVTVADLLNFIAAFGNYCE
jgi:hypothetical protein